MREGGNISNTSLTPLIVSKTKVMELTRERVGMGRGDVDTQCC